MTRPPAATSEGETLLHCSTDRTLLSSTRADGTSEVVKILERANLSEARHEVAMGQRLAGLGVASYLAAEPDPQTGRPCVRMVLHEGTDLETLVAEEGALPPARAARILADIARTLAGMHGIEAPDAPRGLVHGDVKPGNVLAGPDRSILLDLEKTAPCPLAAARRPGGAFTGGTHGFSPPEAYAGYPADAAFDVFGLGATLHFAVTGTLPRPGSLAGLARGITELVEACTAPQPESRPTAERAARILDSLAGELEGDPAEEVLAAVQRADPAAARSILKAMPSEHPRRAELERTLERHERLLGRIVPPEADADLGRDPRRYAAVLRSVQAFLVRFPRHAPSLELRRRARAATVRLLLETPVHVAELNRQARYEDARSLLQGCLELVDCLADQPGRLQVPADGPPRMPGVLQRSPRRFLERTLHEIESNEDAHRQVQEELTTAEHELDLPAAEAVVESLAATFGGASPITAHYKDRLHRLGFYLERLAASRPRLERFSDVLRLTGSKVDLAPLYGLVDRCRERMGEHRDDASGPGMRGLQLTLRDLAEEFPVLDDEARSALGCLHEALVEATGTAWTLLAEAGEKLASEPVPVRPLQGILNRLDSLRLVESFLDLPDRPRSALLDRIESVRMKVDQARATRDRIARGAERAMARGHWTTGLFDMERAVGHLEDDQEETAPESKRLLQRLQDAKRRKREIEQATRRNVELASRYATLQDAPDSRVEERLELLDQRRECLAFLAHHVPADRAALYARDLREVEVLVAQEHAAEAEMGWDATEDPEERLAIANRLLTTLGTRSQEAGQRVGRIQRLIEHWRRQQEQAAREVRRLVEEDHAARRRHRLRRRAFLAAGAAGLVLAAWLGLDAFAGVGRHAQLARQLEGQLDRMPAPSETAAIAGDPEHAIRSLRDAAELLAADPAHPAAPAAVALATALRRPAGPPEQLDLGYWSRHFTEQLGAFAGSVRAWDADGQGADELRAALEELGVRLWRTGVVLAALSADDPAAVDEWEREGERLAAQLQASWLRLPPEFTADLRGLVR